MSTDSSTTDAGGSALREGARYVVRHELPSGSSHLLTDAVGELVSTDQRSLRIRTRRHGVVEISRADIRAIKEIPPTPGRRGRPHRAVLVDDLERIALEGWAGPDRDALGPWVLRAAGGYTGRANSASALGQLDRPLEAALSATQSWYAERGLPPLVQVALAPGSTPADDALVAEAATLGWEWFQLTDVLTAATEEVVAAAATVSPALPDEAHLSASLQLSLPWWDLADERMLAAPDAARTVLTGSPHQEFHLLTHEGRPAARARLALAHGWGGLYAVHTADAFRRRGYGAALVTAAAASARRQGVASMYLQVSADNGSATALYEKLGFTRHHQYVYLRRS